jgi:hypothetical protein
MTHQRESHTRAPGQPRATSAPTTPPAAGGSLPHTSQPAGAPQSRSSVTGRKLTLAPLVRKTLDTAAERRQQRRRLVSTLILAQLLLTLAVSIGYFGSRASLSILIALVAALVIYLSAFVVNALFHHATMATYILILGGGAAVTGQVAAMAFTGNSVDTAQVALFYLAIVLEAGLLLASEVTLIIAGAATALTAAALLLALALGPTVSRRDAYLVVVFSLSLQSLVGLISWLLAQFVSESVDESQRAQELQFAQARLDALRNQTEDQRRLLVSSIATIQATIARAFGGDYSARVDLPEGELSDLANSINLLLRRVEAAMRAEQEIDRRDAAALPVVEALGRMADPRMPPPASPPLITNTPMDSVSIAVSHSQANIALRLQKVQSLAAEIAGAVAHSNEGLTSANEEVTEAQRLAGILISMAEAALKSTHKQLELVARMRRTLGGVLPEGVAGAAEGERAGDLRGLGVDLGIGAPGYTDEFPPVRPSAEAEERITPLTVPLPVVEGAEGDDVTQPLTAAEVSGLLAESARKAREERSSGEHATFIRPLSPAYFEDISKLLADITDEIGQEERGMTSLAHELGMLSRVVRRVDAGVAWAVQALDAIRRDAEQLQQVAGPPLPPPELGGARPANPSRPNPPGSAPRIPQLSRPLSDTNGPVVDESTLAALAGELDQEENPAPGSLRASDLVNLDDLSSPENGA